MDIIQTPRPGSNLSLWNTALKFDFDASLPVCVKTLAESISILA